MIVVAPSLIVALEEHKDRIKNELEGKCGLVLTAFFNLTNPVTI